MKTEIKERPILFSGAMVRAILEGRKTQTRRIVKFDKSKIADRSAYGSDGFDCADLTTRKIVRKPWTASSIQDYFDCPYGKSPDRLWVRETWRPRSWGSDFDWMMIEFAASGGTKEINPQEVWGNRADDVWESIAIECAKLNNPQSDAGDFVLDKPLKWRSPLFLPRAASRILADVVNVRTQKLQDISEEDAKAEGCESMHEDDLGQTWTTYRRGFQSLWDSINSDRGYSWDNNPWVWAIEFSQI